MPSRPVNFIGRDSTLSIKDSSEKSSDGQQNQNKSFRITSNCTKINVVDWLSTNLTGLINKALLGSIISPKVSLSQSTAF